MLGTTQLAQCGGLLVVEEVRQGGAGGGGGGMGGGMGGEGAGQV